ncbi:MAG: hybrid sensor histidine kinase/response regulator [Campylobacterota bacterium]|nr:hybrid sensor histidine kinase/response regulator [Campylobacterota bacterium]
MIFSENDAPRVLLVDDRPENISILIDMLKPLNLDIVVALDAEDVYERVKVYDFDLILLDIIMPDVDGYEVCQILKNNPKYKDIPLIFISALSGVEDKIKGFACGGDDYITKPLLQNELIARVKLHLQKGLLLKSLKQLLRKSYHELYNPLAIINTSLEMQNMKYGSTNYTDAITVASRTLQVVYDDLYYSLSTRGEDRKRVSINLAQFVQKRIDYFYYLSKTKKIVIDFKRSDDTIVEMIEMDIQRIVDNTISNAIKYALHGSVVDISVIDSDNGVIFQSKNNGATIDNPHKIFNQGYRENYEQVGMGIGLEIVASICHNYNIQPEVISEDSLTVFKYKIPKVKK